MGNFPDCIYGSRPCFSCPPCIFWLQGAKGMVMSTLVVTWGFRECILEMCMNTIAAEYEDQGWIEVYFCVSCALQPNYINQKPFCDWHQMSILFEGPLSPTGACQMPLLDMSKALNVCSHSPLSYSSSLTCESGWRDSQKRGQFPSSPPMWKVTAVSFAVHFAVLHTHKCSSHHVLKGCVDVTEHLNHRWFGAQR